MRAIPGPRHAILTALTSGYRLIQTALCWDTPILSCLFSSQTILTPYHLNLTLNLRSPVAPVAYQVILELGIGQFLREFEPRPMHTSINSLGLFSCASTDLRKAREREFATLDGKSTSSGSAEPYAR